MSTSPPPSKRQRLDISDTKSFSIEPLNQFDGACALVKQPVEITCFSYDKQRNLHHDTSSMVWSNSGLSKAQKYYYPPKLNEDLENGFDKFVKFDEIDEHLDSLLASLQRYEETSGKPINVDIITWRGMMTKIMTVLCLPDTLTIDTLFCRG
jgi:RAT1-interacting protein